MSRGLDRSLLTVLLAAALVAGAGADSGTSTAISRFLALEEGIPRHYRALRHLEAQNDQFRKSASMDVWTEADASGFRYQVLSEDGSEYIRTRVFRQTLEAERAVWTSGAGRSAFSPANYTFAEEQVQPDGSTSVVLKPLRKDVLLVHGTIFLSPDDGDLLRMEGRLSKSPSFWTRHVQVKRWYKRIAGVRMPVVVESTANLRIAGRSTFRMTYQYEAVNGQPIE